MRVALLIAAATCSGAPGAPDAPTADAPPDTLADTPADAPPGAAACPPPTTIDLATARQLTVVGDPGATLGINDASVVYPGDATGGTLAYSAVPSAHAIRTRLAVSSDHGATWTYAVEANQPEMQTLASSDAQECPTGSCSGFLVSEVPSLVFDADDPAPAQRWKLFTHRYLVGTDDSLHYRLGTIALQTAGSPAGPWTAPAKLIGWQSSTAYSSAGVVANINALPGGQDCIALTEPGALWLPGRLDLALGCVYLDGGTPRIRVLLVRSTDHTASWQMVSTLLTPADSACVVPGGSKAPASPGRAATQSGAEGGSKAPASPGRAATQSGAESGSINAADLFIADGHEYVSASSQGSSSAYLGCSIFPIDDPAAGVVRRDTSGRAVPVRILAAAPFLGACTFADGSGYLFNAPIVAAQPFRIFYGAATGP